MPDLPFTTLLRAWPGDAEYFRGRRHGEFQRFKAIMPDDEAGCVGFFMGMFFSPFLMVIDLQTSQSKNSKETNDPFGVFIV